MKWPAIEWEQGRLHTVFMDLNKTRSTNLIYARRSRVFSRTNIKVLYHSSQSITHWGSYIARHHDKGNTGEKIVGNDRSLSVYASELESQNFCNWWCIQDNNIEILECIHPDVIQNRFSIKRLSDSTDKKISRFESHYGVGNARQTRNIVRQQMHANLKMIRKFNSREIQPIR